MTGYFLLLVASVLSVYVFFKETLSTENANTFTNPFLSALKTTVMFAGEFEASNLSFDVLPYTSS